MGKRGIVRDRTCEKERDSQRRNVWEREEWSETERVREREREREREGWSEMKW